MTLADVPAPQPIDTVRWPDLAPARANLRTRVETAAARTLFRGAVSRLPVRVHLPDGTTYGAGGPGSPEMTVHDPEAFFGRVGADKLIGFGESYMAGHWDSPDLGAFLTVLASRISTLVPKPLQALRSAVVARHPADERNEVGNTRSNIARHYDLSNDMFATFLDDTMTYSSALYAAPDAAARTTRGRTAVATAPAPGSPVAADLVEAQQRKIDRLLDQAGVGVGSRVLEIGTGWGELCIRAAARGATVRSVTLSSEQKALAEARVDEAGLSAAVTIDLCDYREVTGEYDAVLSVEMIEAVGLDFLPSYFDKIDEVLAPGGRAAIQAIVMPHDRMLATRNTYTWVHKYIFPGGFLPSVELLEQTVTDRTRLRVTDRLSMGLHYAETLRLWDEAFLASREEVHGLGFDSVFDRMWHFYLEYSRAGFAASYIDVQQLTFARPDETVHETTAGASA
ncbi:cyclopropane-fatty-acyl-phospholipid synthase [Marmoricola endophyticus]|uniref:Cyclopropane-fatty-acyl-phospholipid synthase n=1 Tax=Marmoricola endophyticus TaxID=2040280 RepID=A0A917BPI5_9ACTN|nr:cyclopropane-fatty-acyl-phospholipid synthase family protein [Marmoricola endophyticus]GGF53968.1 cyclopropane-fatty-acyl-phospholipid synthase [Marmoricola endophyticus]